jgi:glycosyltransferase involved in cell wall biosynthesis
MKILIIHNKYGKHSGEESVVYAQAALLRSKGHDVVTYYRSSEEIRGLSGRVNAFFSGFYNSKSARDIRDILSHQVTESPSLQENSHSSLLPPHSSFDIVHIHNLYPLISPAILPIITSLPHHLTTSSPKIVMTVHNYRLVCPTGNFFRNGRICEKCSGGKEYNCILHNCERSFFKSTGYALRNVNARIRRLYKDHVAFYATLTEFAKGKLIENGFDPDRVVVIPNFMDPSPETSVSQDRNYVSFAGRMTEEKGIRVLCRAAALIPEIPIMLAGTPGHGIDPASFPPNMTWRGMLSGEELNQFFRMSRAFVLPSAWYEGFPMVLLEAMNHKVPMIGPRHGGFPEIIDEGVNGLLFEPGDAAELADRIRTLWADPERSLQMGLRGNEKMRRSYSGEQYYLQLSELYRRAASVKDTGNETR